MRYCRLCFKKYGYRFQVIPSICKSLQNWEPLCRDLRKVCTEGSSELRKSVSDDIRELVEVVIGRVFPDQIPSSRAANGIRQPASDVETTVPLQSLKQVTGTPGTTRGHRETPVAGHSQQHASRDVEVDDVLSVREHQSNGKLSGPLNPLTTQAIVESVRGFTCEQHEVFLRNLPDVVKLFFLTMLPLCYPSQSARIFSDAAAPQFQNSFDEKTPQTIAERVKGFTCEQLEVFLLSLPDMVKLFFLTMLPLCYPSQSARIFSDAAAPQFHMDENTLDEKTSQAIAESVRGFTCEQHEVFLRNLPDVVKLTISTVLAYDRSEDAAPQFHINENSSDEKTPQTIAERVKGFTCEQLEVFLLNLPDMVKHFYLSMFPAYYPSQGARFFSDAAAPQFQNSFDEKTPQTIAERVKGFTCEQLEEFLLSLPDMVKLFFLTMLPPCYPSQSARIFSDAAAPQFHMDENTLDEKTSQAIAESVRGFTCEQHEVFLRNLPDVVRLTISTVLAYDRSEDAAPQFHINENSSDEKTPQTIAERVKGFTCEQHEVFLLNLPDMVKHFYLSMFPAYYPSQGARFFSDAAAPQFQNSFDEKTPQTIAERVKGFTCEQLEVFLLSLPDMVKLFFLTMLPPCYPSQSARIFSDAAAPQFHMDENTLDEKTSQAIAESVRGFTCEQHGVFLRNLPDVVKRFSLTMPAYYPSQADRFCSDAAAPQFHIDENQRTDNVLTAGGRSQSPEIYGRTASTITSYKGRGKVVQELENLNEGAPTEREEWVTSAELRTEPIRYQGCNLVLYDNLDRPVDSVDPAVNFFSYSPTSSHTVPTSSRPVSSCLSVEEEDIYRELSQRQKPPAGDTDMEIVRERTEEALQQEGSGDAHEDISGYYDYGDELWTFD